MKTRIARIGILRQAPAVQPSPASGTAPGRQMLRAGSKHLRSVFRDVQWSVSYAAFLAFLFVIVTYRLPVGEVAMAVAIIALFLERRRVRFPPALLAFGLFLTWGYVSALYSAFPDVSFKQLEAFGRLWLVFFVAVNVLDTAPRIRFFLVFFLLLFATHPVRGALFNAFLYGETVADRVVWRDSYGNPNDLAALSLLPLGVAAALVKDANRWIRLGARASVVVLPSLILLTQSRAGILALGLLATLTLLGARRRLRTVALVGLVALAASFAAPSGAWERMRNLLGAYRAGDVGQADASADQRLMIWEVGIDIIRDHPVTGVGLGAYPFAHEMRVAANRKWAFAGGPRDIHSTYLGVLAQTGWPGFFLYLTLVAVVLRDSIRTRRRNPGSRSDQLRYLELALYAYLAAGLFGTFFHLSLLYIHLAVVVAMAMTIRRGANHAQVEPAVQASPASWVAR